MAMPARSAPAATTASAREAEARADWPLPGELKHTARNVSCKRSLELNALSQNGYGASLRNGMTVFFFFFFFFLNRSTCHCKNNDNASLPRAAQTDGHARKKRAGGNNRKRARSRSPR
mmetsp:Transcript_14830/g.11899  ORF Transcript_14830/g.11899 Transcript_14830/m.11899 type:complete len:118 (-) Transcript_14830:145-498(-)